MRSDNEFGAFVLSAVIVPFERYAGFESTWKAWKAHRLGADRGVHEPDIRRGNNSFWCEGSYTRRTLAISDLDRVITELDFTEIAVVFHRSDYASLYGEETPDGALPGHGYMMALNFLLERVAMVLEDQFGGARGQLVAESRGPKEDALLQYEFARLQLHGTSYVAAAWFRQQFTQWIVFESKKGNSSGLQMADLAARPLAEKILAPESSPPRWQAFRQKLAPGMETAHSPLGLKIFPWHDRFANLWES